MILATLLCWAAFYLVINTINPFATMPLGFGLFYLSLFFALTGTLALLGFIIRYIFKRNQFITYQVVTSFRQGIWLAVLVVVGLYLQSQQLVAWWNLLILVVLLAVIEYAFSCGQQAIKNKEEQKHA